MGDYLAEGYGGNLSFVLFLILILLVTGTFGRYSK